MRAAHQELSEVQPRDIFYKKSNALEAKKKELIEELVADDMQRIFSVEPPSSILPLQVIMHIDIIFLVFYTVFLILISIYKGNPFILTLPSPWRSPLPPEHLDSGIRDDHLLLHHPGLSAVLRVPCKPHRAHVLYDPVPVCHPA